MKHMLSILLLPLVSCAPFAVATFDPATGNPTAALQSAGTGHKASGTAQEQHIVNPNTGFEYHSTIVQSNPDGVELPTNLANAGVTKKLIGSHYGHENVKSNNSTKEALGAQSVQKNKDTLDAASEQLKILTEEAD